MAGGTPAPIPELPAAEKLLQRLVAETLSRLSPVGRPPEAVGLEKMLRSFLSGQQQRGRHLDSDPSDGIGTELSVSHAESWVMLRLGA